MQISALLIVVLVISEVARGFSPRPSPWSHRRVAGASGLSMNLDDGAPSDSAEFVPQTSQTAPFGTRSKGGAAIKDLLLDTTSMLTRGEINEYVLALERINPTSDPAYSKLLNGVWEVKSTGFGSPGLVGLQVIKAISNDAVDAVTVTISSVAPRVLASTTLNLASAKINVEVTTDIEASGQMRLKETVSAVKLGTFDVPLSSLPGVSAISALTSRELLLTYLDEDLLIARDALGTPEILMRKQALFEKPGSAETGVPSTSDGDGAPGV